MQSATSDSGLTLDQSLDLDAGEQVLVALPSMGDVLGALPESAFENLLVATVRNPDRIERHVRERGLETNRVGIVPISSSTIDYEGPCWTSKRVSPTDLTGISIETGRGARYLCAGEGWFVLDTVHALLMYNDERRLYRLLDSLRRQFGERDVRGVYGIVRETVGTEYDRYRSMFDREIVRK